MLTPQEVSEHAFAKASFGGYNMSMVDEFLDALTTDYTALYKENALLKSKMKVLVDKVEEYRTTEDAMRKALLSAQRMADEMIQEAQRKKELMLAEAEETARVKVAGLRQEIDNEAHRLAVAKDSTAEFLSKLHALCAREMDFFEKFAQIAVEPERPDPVVTAVEDIRSSVEQAVREDPQYTPRRVVEETAQAPVTTYIPPAPAVEQPVSAAAPGGLYDDITAVATKLQENAGMTEQHFEITLGGAKPVRPVDETLAEVDEPTRRIDFDHLQFGRDYDIK